MDLKEFEKARKRVGLSPQKTMAWLVRFAQQPFNSLSLGQFLDLRWEVKAFEEEMPGMDVIAGSYLKDNVQKSTIHIGPENGELFSLPSLTYMESLQIKIKGWVGDLVSKRNIDYLIPKIHMSLTPLLRKNSLVAASYVRYEFPSSPSETLFLFRAFNLLATCLGALRQCSGCQIVFVATHKNKEFCSRACVNRITQQRWRNSQKSLKTNYLSKAQDSPKTGKRQKRAKGNVLKSKEK